MKNKRLVLLFCILAVCIGVFFAVYSRTNFFIPTLTGKLGKENPYNIRRYPNTSDWKEIMSDNHHKIITFSTSDSEQAVFDWYKNYLSNDIWSSRPDMENTYFTRAAGGEYWLGLKNQNGTYTISIGYTSASVPF